MRNLLNPFDAAARGSFTRTAAVYLATLLGLVAGQMAYSNAVTARAEVLAAIDAVTLPAAARQHASVRAQIDRGDLLLRGSQ